MTVAFLKPVPPIPFPLVDDRLEKHGLNLKRERKGVVISGKRGQLLARVRKGTSYFELRAGRVDDIIGALEFEYGTEIIDEYDGRYSGHPDDVPSGMSGLVNGEENIVVYGPLVMEGDLAVEWFRVTRLADDAFKQSDIRGMLLDETDGSIDLLDLVGFRVFAAWLFNRSFRNDGVFVINLDKSIHQKMVVVMMVAGFLRKVGNYYQMAVPAAINLPAIERTVADLLDTDVVDGEKYAIATMTRTDARRLVGQLWEEMRGNQWAQSRDHGNVVLLSAHRKNCITR